MSRKYDGLAARWLWGWESDRPGPSFQSPSGLCCASLGNAIDLSEPQLPPEYTAASNRSCSKVVFGSVRVLHRDL